jgi:hypothetical protein
MRVQMVRFGGIDGRNQRLLPGNVYDVAQELAEALLADGRAIEPIETTAGPIAAMERAVKRAPGRPRKVT